MKVIGEVPIWAGENTVFGEECAAKFVGQIFSKGKVVAANQILPDKIVLTVEIEIPDSVIRFDIMTGLSIGKDDENS